MMNRSDLIPGSLLLFGSSGSVYNLNGKATRFYIAKNDFAIIVAYHKLTIFVLTSSIIGWVNYDMNDKIVG